MQALKLENPNAANDYLAMPPPAATPAEERLQRQQHLVIAFRIFAQLGFDRGNAGHMTVNDPEKPDHFWVNPLGKHFALIRRADLLLVDRDGRVVEGKGKVNLAAFAIHSVIHEERPDALAVAHTHSPHGRAWASLGRLLDPISQDACAFFEDHSLLEEFSGVVLDTSEGARIAQRLGKHKAIILQNHGLLTVGGSVESCAWWHIAMDDCCRIQLMAEAAGKPKLISTEVARKTGALNGREMIGFHAFRNMMELALAEQPDLLD